MRVLHIGKYFPPSAGGIENFTGDLLPALQSQGVDVAALVHNDSYLQRGQQETVIFDIIRVPTYGRFLYAPVSPGFPQSFSRFVANFQPDILHFHLPNTSAFWALLLPSLRKIPWIIHWHSDVVSSKIDLGLALAYKMYRPLEQMMLSRAEIVICTSRRYQQSSLVLRKWRRKCVVVPLGINPQRYKEVSLSDRHVGETVDSEVDEKAFNVLAIGRLTYYKGHDVLVRAAALTKGIKVYIVGQGEQHKKLKQLIYSLGLQNTVFLMGFLPDTMLHQLMAECDCLCLSSVERTEAFGLVSLEAMFYAKPVVASDVAGSGIGWVVDNGKTGILFPVGDADKLAASLQFLAENQKTAEIMGQNGKKKISSLFHINKVAAQVKKIYCALAR